MAFKFRLLGGGSGGGFCKETNRPKLTGEEGGQLVFTKHSQSTYAPDYGASKNGFAFTLINFWLIEHKYIIINLKKFCILINIYSVNYFYYKDMDHFNYFIKIHIFHLVLDHLYSTSYEAINNTGISLYTVNQQQSIEIGIFMIRYC